MCIRDRMMGLMGRHVLGLTAAEVASTLPATTTAGLAMGMERSLIEAKGEWVPLGFVICGNAGMVCWPWLLASTRLAGASPMVRGLALGASFHVSSVAALAACGEAVAADWAALGLFLAGTSRCLLLQVPECQQLVYATYRDTEANQPINQHTENKALISHDEIMVSSGVSVRVSPTRELL
eukprot:TRINITY_DN33049_c0_g1_i1.p1 TRINITY_DN33049_c0_g1~~TRINITY_DN33049_c0_g1_i1.p1  ORF type:complete len:181 (+),score=29.56 TRINITY_DN33049_c0_g1_i1:150-692(+)